MLPPLPPTVVVGKEPGLPETVGAVVAGGDWASYEVCAVVVKKEGGFRGSECCCCRGRRGSELADRVVFEEENVLWSVSCAVVVRDEIPETYDIVVEEGVIEIAESVVVERGIT